MEEKKEKRWNGGGKHLAVSETEWEGGSEYCQTLMSHVLLCMAKLFHSKNKNHSRRLSSPQMTEVADYLLLKVGRHLGKVQHYR